MDSLASSSPSSNRSLRKAIMEEEDDSCNQNHFPHDMLLHNVSAFNHLWRPLPIRLIFKIILLHCPAFNKALCINWFFLLQFWRNYRKTPLPKNPTGRPLTDNPQRGPLTWVRSDDIGWVLWQKSWIFSEHCEVSGVCKWVHSALLPDRHRSSRQGHHYATLSNQHIHTKEIMNIR